MKYILLAFLFVFARAEDAAPSEDSPVAANSSLAERITGYHQRIGVPEAARLKLKEGVSSRIANGLGSYNGEHPYMAGLLVTLTTGQTSLCGGTLLNSRRVLTAASCWFDGYSQGNSILVVLGSVYLYSGGTRVYASQIYTHAYFNPYTAANDIAMLVIPSVSYNSYIRAITLPYGSYLSYSFYDWTAEAIGYGKTYEGSAITTSQSLRDVFISVMSNADCWVYYGSLITSDILCTSGAGGKGPCGGDMGGPLIIRRFDGVNDMLIGVVSFGSTSGCEAGHPTAYTRITQYMPWIRNLM